MAFQSSRRPARYQVCATQAKSNYCLFIWREWFFNCFYGSKQWVIWLLHLGSSQSPLLGRGNIATNTFGQHKRIKGQFKQILSIFDKAYFVLRIQIMFVFTLFSENMRISPPAPSRPGQPVAKFQRPAVERLVAGRRALVRGGAGSFNQHLGPCFTNSVVPLPIFKLSTRSGRGHTAAQPAQPPSPHHKTETKRLLIFLGCIKQRLKSTQI